MNKLAIAAALIGASVSTQVFAITSSEAATQCKRFVKTNYPEADMRKQTRIKSSRGSVRVNYTIKEDGEKTKGICLVSKDDLSFTVDGVAIAAK